VYSNIDEPNATYGKISTNQSCNGRDDEKIAKGVITNGRK
jgi:hypothetical protein